MGISMEAQKEAILEKSKKTMSVPEMRRLLGLKKTDSYWLVHRNFFQTYIVNGQMRVDIASFEKWYANQVKHKKEFRSKYLKNGMNIRSCIRKSAGCLRSRIWKKTISVCRRQQPSPGLPAEQSPNGFRWGIFQVPGQERP